MLANFDLLIGGSAATAIPLILSVPVVLVIGVLYGKAGHRVPAEAAPHEDSSLPWPGLGTDPDEPTDLLPA